MWEVQHYLDEFSAVDHATIICVYLLKVVLSHNNSIRNLAISSAGLTWIFCSIISVDERSAPSLFMIALAATKGYEHAIASDAINVCNACLLVLFIESIHLHPVRAAWLCRGHATTAEYAAHTGGAAQRTGVSLRSNSPGHSNALFESSKVSAKVSLQFDSLAAA